MVTLKLKKPAHAAAPAGGKRDALKPARPPVRGANGPRPRPTLQQAQKERAERDERFKKAAGSAPLQRVSRPTPDRPDAPRSAFGNPRDDRPAPRPASKPSAARDNGFRGAASNDFHDTRNRPAAAPERARSGAPAESRGRPDTRPGTRPETRPNTRPDTRPDRRPDTRDDSTYGHGNADGGRPSPRSRDDGSGPGPNWRPRRDLTPIDTAPERSEPGGERDRSGPNPDARGRRDTGPRGHAFGNDRPSRSNTARPDRNDRGAGTGNGSGEIRGKSSGKSGGPGPDWRPRQDIAPRGSAPVGGRDRRPDLRKPRREAPVVTRPDVRPALPPEPELRSEIEHRLFPDRPTGQGPAHVQGPGTSLVGVRLSKRMSELGLASRREADDWIQRGWVKVDGVVISTLGSRVTEDQKIEIDERGVSQQAQRVTVLLNKPAGYVSGQAEDGHQPANVLCTPDHRSALDTSGIKYTSDHVKGIAPAGRLDMDSTGLLVYTQDGRIAKQLIGGDGQIEKEYIVRVGNDHGEGRATGLSDESLALLNHGIELEGVPLRPAEVSWLNDDELRFVLREGKKRQIRRMCEAVGLQVLELKRIRIGNVALGDLAEGEWRYLGADESFVDASDSHAE